MTTLHTNKKKREVVLLSASHSRASRRDLRWKIVTIQFGSSRGAKTAPLNWTPFREGVSNCQRRRNYLLQRSRPSGPRTSLLPNVMPLVSVAPTSAAARTASPTPGAGCCSFSMACQGRAGGAGCGRGALALALTSHATLGQPHGRQLHKRKWISCSASLQKPKGVYQ